MTLLIKVFLIGILLLALLLVLACNKIAAESDVDMEDIMKRYFKERETTYEND